MINILALYLLILILKLDFIAPLWKQWVVWVGGWHNAMTLTQTAVGAVWMAYLLFAKARWWKKIALNAILAIVLTVNCCDWQEGMVSIIFFALGWLMKKKGFYLWVVVIAGIIPELTQLFYIGRVFDYRDIACNLIAVILGFCMGNNKQEEIL